MQLADGLESTLVSGGCGGSIVCQQRIPIPSGVAQRTRLSECRCCRHTRVGWRSITLSRSVRATQRSTRPMEHRCASSFELVYMRAGWG